MRITHNLTIDLQHKGNLKKIDVVQGDAYTRSVSIKLYDNGILWDIPQESTILVRYSKPDGTAGIYEWLPDGSIAGYVEDNTVTVLLAPQMFTCPGRVPTQVSLVVDDQILSTFYFVVDVEADPSKGASGSESYFNWKTAFIPQVSNAHVGHYLEIESVDSNGRIEAVKDVPNPAITAELKAQEAKRTALEAEATANSAYANAEMAIQHAAIANESATSASEKADEALETANYAQNTSARNADDIADLERTKLPQVTGAKVGQYIMVTGVDDEGRITAFAPVDAPTSGSIDGDLDMKDNSINGVGSLSFNGPDANVGDGFWIQANYAISKEDGSKTSVVQLFSNDTDDPVVIRNVSPAQNDNDVVNLAQLNSAVSGKLDAPATAEIGQTIVVKAVDETGKPTAWEAVDLLGGGNGEVELIANITLTEEVNVCSVDIPEEKYNSLFIYGYSVGTESSPNDVHTAIVDIHLSDGSIIQACKVPGYINKYAGGFFFMNSKITEINSVFYGYGGRGNFDEPHPEASSSSTCTFGCIREKITLKSEINCISVYAANGKENGAFGAGSKIMVWGGKV